MTAEDTMASILVGHDDAVRQLTSAFASERMHHAWLITGIEGIGKATLALHLAHHVLSKGQNPIGNISNAHRTARLIAAGSHPDMLVLRREANDKGELRDAILVEEALKITSFLHKTATENGWRVVVVDEAHALNRHGQNAILKILEEPPRHALLVLTATSSGVLLPTIRSRCRQLSLDALGDVAMKVIIRKLLPESSSDDIMELVALSGGSVGFALKMVRSGAIPLLKELRVLLGAMPEFDITRVHKMADQLGRKADAECFDVVTGFLQNLLRERVKAQATGTMHEAVPLAHLPLDRALRLYDSTQATLSLASRGNLDRKLAFINVMSDIKRVAA